MRSVSRREKYVGIQKQPAHLLGPSVRNRIGIDAKFLDGLSCSAVIRDGGSRGEEEFCFTLGAVPFDGNDDGRTNQDAVFSGFGGHRSGIACWPSIVVCPPLPGVDQIRNGCNPLASASSFSLPWLWAHSKRPGARATALGAWVVPLRRTSTHQSGRLAERRPYQNQSGHQSS